MAIITIQEIFEMRKQGHIEEAYNAIVSLYKQYKGHYTTLCMFWTGLDMMAIYNERIKYREAADLLKTLHSIFDERFAPHPAEEASKRAKAALDKYDNIANFNQRQLEI